MPGESPIHLHSENHPPEYITRSLKDGRLVRGVQRKQVLRIHYTYEEGAAYVKHF